MPIVFGNIIGRPLIPEATPGKDVPPEREAGKYRFEAAGIDLDIQWKDSKLTADVPGQPTYVLEKVAGRRYKMGGAPDGFFITFRDKELFLEQPQGNFTLPRADSLPADSIDNANALAAKELIGKYTSESSGRGGEVREQNGKIVFVVGTQPPVSLVAKANDQYWMKPLPDSYWISVKRTADGKIEKIGVNQPEGEFFFRPGGAAPLAMTADELMGKVIDASGGEVSLKKLTSRVTVAEVDLEQQGVKGIATTWSKAPNKAATETTFTALGVEIATGWDYFDGEKGEQTYSFSPTSKYTGKRLEDMKLSSDFYLILDWKPKFKKVSVERIAKCGDEECYVVEFEPNAGTKFTDYYSTKTFLLMRRDGSISSSISSVETPYSTTFGDYRDVDGVKIPFRNVNNTSGGGDIVTIVKSVKHNVKIEDSFFAPRTNKK